MKGNVFCIVRGDSGEVAGDGVGEGVEGETGEEEEVVEEEEKDDDEEEEGEEEDE